MKKIITSVNQKIILFILLISIIIPLVCSQEVNYISIVPVTASSSGECGSSFDLMIGEEGSFISYSSTTFTFGSFIANHNQAAVIRRFISIIFYNYNNSLYK